MRRGTRRRLGVLLLAAVLLRMGGGAAWASQRVSRLMRDPARPGSTRQVLVVVPRGSDLRQISTLLQSQGVVRSGLAFEWFVRRQHRSRSLEAGTYALGPGMTPGQILNLLVAGHVADRSVIVPEGWTATQVISAFAAAGVGSPTQGLQAMRDVQLLARAGLPAPGPGAKVALEGYLFPATYSFPPEWDAQRAVQAMVQRFQQAWTPALQAAAAQQGLNTLQAVTLASIVQREVTSPEDMTVVAGIYLRRLHMGMKLDADPTVLYGLGIQGQDGGLTAAELSSSSPYNTYQNAGLPPGPICNPGLDALEAVAHPDTSGSALYFLTAPSGQLVLADTLSQQLTNRQHYLGY